MSDAIVFTCIGMIIGFFYRWIFDTISKKPTQKKGEGVKK